MSPVVITGQSVHSLEMSGQHKKEESSALKSTLYNPMRTPLPDLAHHITTIHSFDNSVSLLTIVPDKFPHNLLLISTSLGEFPKGSALTYQQNLHSDFVLNILNPLPFPDLPVEDHRIPTYHTVLSEIQIVALSTLSGII